jgi:GTPase
MFVDEVKVFARAGHGGRGCVAFHREAYCPKGGPSGGNGGRGGDVILEANHDLNNLVAQYYQPKLLAEDGEGGMGKGMDGHAGKDILVKVPCGTMVWSLNRPAEATEPAISDDASAGAVKASQFKLSRAAGPILRYHGGMRALEVDLSQQTEHEHVSPSTPSFDHSADGNLVADLTQHGQRFTLCRGGRGGLGNRNFATARRQTPRFAQPGEPGEEGDFLFELRILAEVGLVGFPNAGKSTLLTAISRARPKIAPYPFTTLHPQVGIVEYEDMSRLTVCDVPGLIEGAHRNLGLGHAFLRHIQRCRVLVFLVDMAGSEGRLPWDDYAKLLEELRLHNPEMLEKPRLIAANKMDEAAAGSFLRRFRRRIHDCPVLPMSAAFDQGLDTFKRAIRKAVTAQAEAKPQS